MPVRVQLVAYVVENVDFKGGDGIALSYLRAGGFISTFVTPLVSLPQRPEANRGDYRLLSKVSFGIMDQVVSDCNVSVPPAYISASSRTPERPKKGRRVDVVSLPIRGFDRPKRRAGVAPSWPEPGTVGYTGRLRSRSGSK